jgi:lipoate-protein ligase B
VLRVRSLGTVPYHEAFALQHALATGTEQDYLLILQHPHVYTLGAHADRRHVLSAIRSSQSPMIRHPDRRMCTVSNRS